MHTHNHTHTLSHTHTHTHYHSHTHILRHIQAKNCEKKRKEIFVRDFHKEPLSKAGKRVLLLQYTFVSVLTLNAGSN